jgi:predicted nucleic acid-binding protein
MKESIVAAKLELYLDTSVISAYIDERDAVRQEMTRRFWLELPYYAGHICPIVLDEISKTLDAARREQMLALARSLIVLPWQEEMERLAEAYVAQGAFTPVLMQDARHVAAAVVSGIPVLLSWNFRHLVNRTRRIRVNLVNSERGYEQIEIIAPPELV